MQFLLVRGSDNGAILARFHLNNTCFFVFTAEPIVLYFL